MWRKILKDEECDMALKGFEMFTIKWLNRKGGVTLYIDTVLMCTVLENMCDTVEDMFECETA